MHSQYLTHRSQIRGGKTHAAFRPDEAPDAAAPPVVRVERAPTIITPAVMQTARGRATKQVLADAPDAVGLVARSAGRVDVVREVSPWPAHVQRGLRVDVPVMELEGHSVGLSFCPWLWWDGERWKICVIMGYC